MKLIYIFLAALSFLMTSVNANAIQCPSPQLFELYVTQFVKEINPVPFTQCYYTAKMSKFDKINYCEQLDENISANLLKASQIEISNWQCHFFPEQNNQYNYVFTFLATYK